MSGGSIASDMSSIVSGGGSGGGTGLLPTVGEDGDEDEEEGTSAIDALALKVRNVSPPPALPRKFGG